MTPTDRVEVLALVEARDEVERLLEGWAEACGAGGLAWLWDRVNVYRKARS